MTHPESEGIIKVGITCGDINGIGLEVIMKCLLDNRMHQVCTPVIYASNKLISLHRKHLNLNDFQYQTIRGSNDIILRKTNVINCWEDEVQVDFGKASDTGGKYAFLSLQSALKDLNEKKIDVLVTAPINKKTIHSDQFNFPGHTEYLASNFPGSDVLMVLTGDDLRVATVTGHIALSEVPKQLSIDKIVQKIKLFNLSLKKDFGLRKPKIAVLGLNPHAGDEGLLGVEERDIIIPAIKKCFAESIFVYGPYAADGYFGSGTYKKFDAVLGMYHDQSLIPFKTLRFANGVNYTAGLPVIRTSPDHGTAFDIAGKNMADESSIREAIYVAIDIMKNREMYQEINESPLAFSKQSRDQ